MEVMIVAKKQETGPSELKESGPEEPVEETVTAPEHWRVTVWGVLPRWACSYCPFDTLDGEEAMAEHYRAEHAPPPLVVAPSLVQVYDRWGNPVN